MIRIVDGLYLGNRECARDLRRLHLAGITHIVNCTCELPNYHEDHFTYRALNLTDPDPEFLSQIPEICRFIDQARQKGNVLVHCFAAVSRSPAVVLSYLCHLGDTLDQSARQMGSIVWTDPDLTFLEQVARFYNYPADEDTLRWLSSLLQGQDDTQDKA